MAREPYRHSRTALATQESSLDLEAVSGRRVLWKARYIEKSPKISQRENIINPDRKEGSESKAHLAERSMKGRARRPPMRNAARGAKKGGSTDDTTNLEADEASLAAAVALTSLTSCS